MPNGIDHSPTTCGALTALVVDASAAVHLASMATMPPGMGRYECVAPRLMWSEALSALVEGAFRGEIPASALEIVLKRLEELPIAVVAADAGHRLQSLRLARSLGWAKSYDAEYIVLAQALECAVLTVDARLTRGAGHLVAFIGPTGLRGR